MKRIGTWISHNILLTIAIAIILVLLFRMAASEARRSVPSMVTSDSYMDVEQESLGFSVPRMGNTASKDTATESYSRQAPSSEQRITTKNASLSLLVTNVEETLTAIQQEVSDQNGFIVSSSVSYPTEEPTAHITARVPKEQLEEITERIKNLGLKVVSEEITGADITDQYRDVEERLRVLTENKERMEEIMAQATTVDQIVSIQQQLFQIQDQIDALKGEQQYLEQSAQMSRLSIYLSSDELSLPYVPDNQWRPEVIFKNAVRSLFTTFQAIGSLAIWMGVFSVIWGPALIGYLVWKKRKK
jgi:hypothetical protein